MQVYMQLLNNQGYNETFVAMISTAVVENQFIVSQNNPHGNDIRDHKLVQKGCSSTQQVEVKNMDCT